MGIDDKKPNVGERELFFYLRNRAGSFHTNLFNTIFSADGNNRLRLSTAFPEEVGAVHRLQNEPDYHEKLEESMSF